MMIDNGNPQLSIPSILKVKKEKNEIALSAEIIPPRNGVEVSQIFRQIEALKTVPIDFISVTKGAGGSLRGGTLPIAQMIKNQFEICSLAHFTCRDYTCEEIENHLMDHHYFGVSNILALRGDPPDGKPDHFKPDFGRHTYAWQLVEQIRRLNQGQYLLREGYDNSLNSQKKQKTNFSIGVAAHPEHEPIDQAVSYLAQKMDKGAQFAITQMFFEAKPYIRFVDLCRQRGIHIPIIPGLRIITNAATAERMIKKFAVKIPNTLLSTLSQTSSKEECKKRGLEFTKNLCDQLIAYGAPGIHIFVMNDEISATQLLKSLKNS